MYTNPSNLFFRDFLEANLFFSLQKVVPHAQQHPVYRFPSCQQVIDFNDQQNLQYTPNKFSIFGSSSKNQATIRYVYAIILSTVYSFSSDHTKIKDKM